MGGVIGWTCSSRFAGRQECRLSISKIVNERAGVGIGLAPEVEERGGGIAGRPALPERVVPAVEELAHGRQCAGLGEDTFQILALAESRVLAEIHFVFVPRPLP